jgi:CMP-N,N'-diacetyllegionaminic acid synthase
MEISTVSCLAIIPARQGSKGVPNKNIVDCAGKPLLAWTIEAARSAGYIKDTIVSTDCPKIARIAESFGANVPFRRKKELADDDASVVDVVYDVLNQIPCVENKYELIALLQPTSPLRTHRHIDEAISKFLQNRTSETDTMFSAVRVDSKVLWTFHADQEDRFVVPVQKKLLVNPRRQTLPKCYAPNGAIYIAQVPAFSGFFGEKTLVYEMGDVDSIDVDSYEDLSKATHYLLER